MQIHIGMDLFTHSQQRINHRITSDENILCVVVFLQQIGTRSICRCKVVLRECGREFAVALFRPRGIDIARSQTRFNMTYRNLLIIRG
ncbi:Uncharacterised protein [Vibrio cholerae]|nr:Uncharacterised protein [Vibrio cholerae]CSC90581.1 Uncharacterised protein [Vibrio cholerae]